MFKETTAYVHNVPLPKISAYPFESIPSQQPIPNESLHPMQPLANDQLKIINRNSYDSLEDLRSNSEIKSEQSSLPNFVGLESIYSMPELIQSQDANVVKGTYSLPATIEQTQKLNKNKIGGEIPSKQDTMNDMLLATLKKYNVKNYFLRKILGTSHEFEEDEGGFFSNKHLKRHGTAGVAAKVLGELIGIKIRESIEGIGKSFSEYAKDFTTRNFVNIGHIFARLLKF